MINYNDIRDKSQEERLAMAGKFYEMEEYGNCELVISFILDAEPHDRGALSLLGAMYQRQDRYGMSEMVFRYGLALYQDFVPMWAGLGTAIRDPFRHEESLKVLEHALELEPDNSVALANIASMYVEIAEYEKALEYANRALKKKPDAIAAMDAIGLASLGLEDFKTGWDMNQKSLGVKWRKEIVYGDEAKWDGEKDSVVIVYGEQGIGDEIFYGSVIPDIIDDSKKVIIDCDPRLEGLFKRSFPKAAVYGTRDKAASWLNNHRWYYRCAMADLSHFYRNDKKDFPGTPFLKPDPVRAKQWEKTFAGDTKIGIALKGGNKFTNRASREIPIEIFRPLLSQGSLVSLEYSDYDYGGFPIEVYDWAAQSDDYDNVAAMVSELDFVVTTCTAIVHLAGGLGVPCYVMTNKYPSWRYAHDMPWYKSVHVIHCDGDWELGMHEVKKLIELRKSA